MSTLKNNEQKENEIKNNYTVYIHISPSNKKYIGVTGKNVNDRWRNGTGYRGQKYFYNAIQKYGWDNFEHIILNNHLSKEEAYLLESKYISEYSSNNHEYGYNISSGGIGGCGLFGELNGMYGVSPKDRMDEKTYKSWIKKQKACKHIENYKKIICLTTNKIFDSIKEASNFYHINERDISSCCRNILFSAGKHPNTKDEMVWQFYDDYIKGIQKPQKKTIPVYCITTEEYFDRTIDAANKYNINPSGITLCCQNKQKYCGEKDGKVLQWVYYEDYLSNKIPDTVDKRVICLNTMKIYKDLNEAEQDTGILHSNISQCCYGKTSYAGIINGEKMIWQMYSNYLSGNLLMHKSKKTKSVICVNDNKIFNSTKEATVYYGVKRKNDVAECCRNEKKYVYDKNNNKLIFKYI